MLNRLRSKNRGKGTTIVVWTILGILMVGLTGLGLGGAVSSLSSQNVATVGDQKVSREDYVRTLLRQIDAVSQQTGQRLSMAQAREFGLDREVLRQMVILAALDAEMKDLQVSVGDTIVARELRATPAFQGLTGGFDRQSYDFYLDRQGQTAGEYERKLRTDIARTLLQVAVTAGTEMPPVMAETVLAFDREARRFRTVTLTQDATQAALPEPDAATLTAYYEANPDAYTTPETRVVSYAALLPADMAAQIEISDEELRAAFAERADSYARPERRVLDVIAFASTEAAQQALDRIKAGELTYAGLAQERGLSESDISLGPVVAGDLGAAARAAVFGAAEPGVIGPVDTDLGPALYRLNAIIAAQSRSFEDVADALRTELAAQRAESEVLGWIGQVQDLVAAGATLEEIAQETPLTFGEIGLTDTPGEGLAGDAAFRAEAFAAEPGEERDLLELDNGGIAVLRVERVEPPELRPFDQVAADVRRDWAVAERRSALVARAESLKALLDAARTLDGVAAAEGLAIASYGPVTRGASLEGDLPAGLLEDIFALDQGESVVIGDGDRVIIAQLDEIIPADPADPAQAQDLARLTNAIDASLGRDLFDAYSAMVTDQAAPNVNQSLIDTTLAQYP